MILRLPSSRKAVIITLPMTYGRQRARQSQRRLALFCRAGLKECPSRIAQNILRLRPAKKRRDSAQDDAVPRGYYHVTLMDMHRTTALNEFRMALLFVLSLMLVVFTCLTSSAQIGGKAGAYSRMGFGARGMGMGNALTAVTNGDAVAYYNPAALPFAQYRNVSASFGVLAFDRQLNFLSYAQPLKGNAGISAGIINSGVSNIDGRDSDGEPTGNLKTSENQVFLGFGTQMQNGLAIGLNVKYLYHHLYTDVNSSTFGVDIGALFPVSTSLTIGFVARDILSKYSWNTNTIYERGTQVEDKFPKLYNVGASYSLPDSFGIAAVDVEFSNQSTIVLKAGIEVPLIPEITLRAGMDRIDLKEKGNGVRPTFGFTARKSFDDLIPAINYAYIMEPFASSSMHMISLSVIF